MYREIIERFTAAQPFLHCIEKTVAQKQFNVTGITGSSAAFLITGLAKPETEQFAVIVPDHKTAELLRDDIEAVSSRKVLYFPAYRGIHLEEDLVNSDIRLARLRCLQNLSQNNPGIYIIEISAVIQTIISPQSYRNRLLTLTVGEETDFNLLVSYLSSEGFVRQSMVEDCGDMAVRGGIIDVFSPNSLEPIRIEFNSDSIDSIRIIDINTQRSIRTVAKTVIVSPLVDSTGGSFIDVSDGSSLPKADLSLTETITAYLRPSAPILLYHPAQAHNALAEYWKHLHQVEEPPEQTELAVERLFNTIQELCNSRHSAVITVDFGTEFGQDTVSFFTSAVPAFNRNLKVFSELMNTIAESHPKLLTAVYCDNQGQADRLHELFLEEELLRSCYLIRVGALSEGFLFTDANIALINDHEIFSRKYFRKPKRDCQTRKVVFDELSLNFGDYVVHEDYGIGQYVGLKKITVGKSEQEALKLAYADGDTLYLNIERLPYLEKYTGREGYTPDLSKLGSADWERVKKRTKKAVETIAKDLIALYAKRTIAEGFACLPDTQWQRELEASFQYDETPDQLKACWDIKKDLESPRPMDRLICGDVGFGKTEVALRAAFKVISNGKQAAVLVPTTILAQQHYETFRERLKLFPVIVEVLSRFCSPKEQKRIVEGLKKGSVDIVIGTHRLLSKDVAFKDLGLIIIDEEQRFGVTHKERLKHLRTEVDVLTMTATPIPRTLHMSLTGVRDLSVINTPPKNRLPIITEIAHYNDELVRAAIIKELDRGGQIYFVHNRVQTIYKMLSKLERLVPEATFGVAHGQMKEKKLEHIMLSFLRGEFDCLMTTMIIESGIDIPTVNTIIINQADNFGLAQLYQLRGRVGRSDVQAFAYLLTPPYEAMTKESLQRLQTLTEYTELGSGLQIALKDLEIRGAGNLLGREQSGYINAIGFEMYNRLLKEMVAEQMSGEQLPEKTLPDTRKKYKVDIQNVKIDTDIPAYIPDHYVSDSFQRVSYYRRISLCETSEMLMEIEEELADRYGAPPSPAQHLLILMALKCTAAYLLFDKLQIARNKFTGSFTPDTDAPIEKKEHLAQLVSTFVGKSNYPFSLKQDKKLKIELPLPKNITDGEKLIYVQHFLKSLSEMAYETSDESIPPVN